MMPIKTLFPLLSGFPIDSCDPPPSWHLVSSLLFLFHATYSSGIFKHLLLTLWRGGQRELRVGLFLMKECFKSHYLVFHFDLPNDQDSRLLFATMHLQPGWNQTLLTTHNAWGLFQCFGEHVLINELLNTWYRLIKPVSPLLSSQRVLIPISHGNNVTDLTKNSEVTLSSEIQRTLVLSFLFAFQSRDAYWGIYYKIVFITAHLFLENNYFHRVCWVSTYYRALALSGEKGIVNSKYTDDEWAILAGVPNRGIECIVGTTDMPERPAAFLEMPKCLPSSMMVPPIKTNEPAAWRS